MALSNVDAVIEAVEPLIGAAWGDLTTTQQEQMVGHSLNELGMSLPETNTKRCYWIIERSKRHGLYSIVVLNAERFRYKQIHLQQKFDNYFRLITQADEAFAKAMENDISGIFPDDIVNGDAFAESGFFYNPAGFVYDQLGRDLTYAY